MQDVKFHLAIPSKDLKESMEFYSQLGCKIGRMTKAYIIVDFFGMQLVCHGSDECDEEPTMYPRHFGIILKQPEWFYLLQYSEALDIPFFQKELTRFPGLPQEHKTFFLKDPSNNLIEFKAYKDQRSI